ncbi:DUF1677 family protein [Quillaja saponaria]|uniref:DUF1677 family protein n=1 Tax=Quillaja saponaria TaxID=32244 RepID=A0AAD7LD87_QUISA|nr:DUF1677 family protein [Quillaja saponaria]
MAISGSESQTPTNNKSNPPPIEVESVKCDSCGFTEECTPAYILRLRERYQGRWLCGLCIEAVKDEVLRSDRLISTEEALNRHISFCKNFRSSTPVNETEHPIFAMSRVIRRNLDTPRPHRSNSSGALPSVDGVRSKTLVRTGSCFSSLSRAINQTTSQVRAYHNMQQLELPRIQSYFHITASTFLFDTLKANSSSFNK